MVTPTWEEVKEFYLETFGIKAWAVEIMANIDILVLCASGSSNLSISNFTEVPLDEVTKVIEQTFKFQGWLIDLPVNPYGMYRNMINRHEGASMSKFIKEVREVLNPFVGLGELDFEFMFTMCVTMDDIESRVYDEWI